MDLRRANRSILKSDWSWVIFISKVASSGNSEESVLGIIMFNSFISYLEGNIK